MSKGSKPSPYDVVTDRLSRDNAIGSIEDAVARRLPQRRLNKAIARESQALFDALPTKRARDRWFRWERLTSERAYEQDRALFDFAYACGATDAQASAWPVGSMAPTVARLRAAMLAENIEGVDRVRVLLVVALALVTSGDGT